MGLGNMSSCLPLLVILCCGLLRGILSQVHMCQPGYRFDPSRNKCLDINECETTPCGLRKKCWNIIGSYRCQCKDGYNTINQDCEDIDECNSSPCAREATCQNTDGSFQCICSTGFQSTEKAGSNGRRSCEVIFRDILSQEHKCQPGYRFDPSQNKCVDINECEMISCGPRKKCWNTIGYFKCQCKDGYNTINQDCEDIDECNSSPCAREATCQNTDGSFQCICSTGFQSTEKAGSNGRRSCEVIFRDILSQEHKCQPGHRFDPSLNKCFDINECETISCGPRKKCWNSIGSYKCQCKDGYNTINQDCEDIDECNSSPCAREATCQNTDGSFQCICSTGFQSTEKAGSNGRRSCEDIDECKSSPCHEHATCINVVGSYQCNCNTGFQAVPATANLTAGKVCEGL
ncbi:latent-transforming growth factor beta-binding protein 4-like isoform X3 [Hypanus sabinus]|uniref:latent-transforming growth factor beta-binding protein 4-like isoform X3 n=1 Tax=Hypanus sabinus TaxID=79690 RepID=UPI0028C464A5|nr:latent-transforming growth factor beta-binding protein 4-like isoform X3 [Hypanus sabinus]